MAMNSCRFGQSAANPAVETTAEQDRIDPIDEMPQPALAWDAVMELGDPPQEGEMVFAPGDDVVEIIARSDGRASHQQQDLLEGIHDPPGLAVIPEFGKMRNSRPNRARGISSSIIVSAKVSMIALQANQSA
jgi:hypothetical protein